MCVEVKGGDVWHDGWVGGRSGAAKSTKSSRSGRPARPAMHCVASSSTIRDGVRAAAMGSRDRAAQHRTAPRFRPGGLPTVESVRPQRSR